VRGPRRLLRFRRPHHRVEQLTDKADRVDLVVVAAGREAEQLGAEVSPIASTADTSSLSNLVMPARKKSRLEVAFRAKVGAIPSTILNSTLRARHVQQVSFGEKLE
jgi:hypothetical protein